MSGPRDDRWASRDAGDVRAYYQAEVERLRKENANRRHDGKRWYAEAEKLRAERDVFGQELKRVQHERDDCRLWFARAAEDLRAANARKDEEIKFLQHVLMQDTVPEEYLLARHRAEAEVDALRRALEELRRELEERS